MSVFGTICTHGSLMQHYQAAEFSKEVSRLAAAPIEDPPQIECTTTGGYASLTGYGFDLLGPTAAQIATFLYELFDTCGLSPQIIKGYRSCLASFLSRTGMAAAVQAKT